MTDNSSGAKPNPERPPARAKRAAAKRAEETGSPLVVGVGASAGGLDAFSELLEALPASPGFAIVFIMHLQPTHVSDLAAILGRRTSMPVVQVENGMRVEQNHVYVIPPNTEMRLADDALELSPRPSGGAPSLTVDKFLTSLAEQRGETAIGVILSGSASDGTQGLAAIKEKEGITLVQDPDSAAFRGMPESAEEAGVADVVLTIDQIADELVRLAKHPGERPAKVDEETPSTLSSDEELALLKITWLVRQATGLDLTHYKRPTLLRRIGRRMMVRSAPDMDAYASALESDPTEVTRLLKDVLVGVTSFFRDPEAFDALKAEILPMLLETKPADAPIRVWVPGCATGQEAYSIAIVLLEQLLDAGSTLQIQIFASDLREDDLAFARRGVFPLEIAAEVSQERLERFFTQMEDGYQISKAIRDSCIFARHDVTRDPPFARMDIVSCRNLLIYLDATLQRRILTTLHYALIPDGILMLGTSEGIGAAPGLFRRTPHKGVFMRLPGNTPLLESRDFAPPILGQARVADQLPPEYKAEREREWADAQRQLDAMLLDKYAPAALLVDDRLQVKQIRGDAGQYLRFRPGDASLDLASMVSVGFASVVKSAMAEARETLNPARREGMSAGANGGHSAVQIVVIPIATEDQPLSYAVLFDDTPSAPGETGARGAELSETDYLRQELDAATTKLRILREGRDMANEALRAANEEIQSSNEELQSMNEELETAKEELQSTNEELTTLNDELQSRNVELAQRNDDLNNLLVSASIAMLVLDRDLMIRRFTSQAAEMFNLIPGDIGRRITDIRWRIPIEDIEELFVSVVKSGRPVEREVTDDSGSTFNMTVRPYTTSDGKIEGSVVTLVRTDVPHPS